MMKKLMTLFLLTHVLCSCGEKIESGDPDIYALLTHSGYNLPTALPDGTYKH
ncbi:MAG: hypothetical protein ABJG78_01105 [Cyclobacteriaceae bacterium]